MSATTQSELTARDEGNATEMPRATPPIPKDHAEDQNEKKNEPGARRSKNRQEPEQQTREAPKGAEDAPHYRQLAWHNNREPAKDAVRALKVRMRDGAPLREGGTRPALPEQHGTPRCMYHRGAPTIAPVSKDKSGTEGFHSTISKTGNHRKAGLGTERRDVVHGVTEDG